MDEHRSFMEDLGKTALEKGYMPDMSGVEDFKNDKQNS